jgi:hypothetical protein
MCLCDKDSAKSPINSLEYNKPAQLSYCANCAASSLGSEGSERWQESRLPPILLTHGTPSAAGSAPPTAAPRRRCAVVGCPDQPACDRLRSGRGAATCHACSAGFCPAQHARHLPAAQWSAGCAAGSVASETYRHSTRCAAKYRSRAGIKRHRARCAAERCDSLARGLRSAATRQRARRRYVSRASTYVALRLSRNTCGGQPCVPLHNRHAIT